MSAAHPNGTRVQAVILLFASSLTIMSGAALAAALPALQDHFSGVANVELLSRLVLTLPALFIVLTSPLAGVIVDRWGRKRLLLFATALFVVGGSSGFFVETLSGILIGRAVLGVAVAGVMTASTTLIADYFSGESRNRMMGMQAAWMGLGGMVYVAAGGLLSDLNWRAPFLIYISAVIVIPFMIAAIHEPRAAPNHHSGEDNSPTGRLPLGIAAAAYGLTFASLLAFFLIPVQLAFHLRDLLGASATESGLAIAFANLANGIIAVAYQRIKRRLSYESIFVVGFALMGAGFAMIYAAATYSEVLLAMALCGTGTGLILPNAAVWLVTSMPASVRGRAIGGLTTSFFLGQFFSPLASQPVNERFGLDAAFGFAGLAMVLIALVFTGRAVVRRLSGATRRR